VTIHRSLPVVAAAALLLLSGLVHGLWTDRWRSSEGLVEAVARVDQVPLTVGDWEGRTLGPPDTDPEAFAQAGALGYWTRSYVNRRTGKEVTAILMCGQRSRMAVHTPEVCYRAAGYEQVDAAVPYVVMVAGDAAAEAAEFRTTLFSRPGGGPGAKRLRVLWGWNAGGDWQAPAGDARWTFRGVPFLYKLYVVHDVTGPSGPREDDAGVAFLKRLVPELRHTLCPVGKS
jgi:hypothetical protein